MADIVKFPGGEVEKDNSPNAILLNARKGIEEMSVDAGKSPDDAKKIAELIYWEGVGYFRALRLCEIAIEEAIVKTVTYMMALRLQERLGLKADPFI